MANVNQQHCPTSETSFMSKMVSVTSPWLVNKMNQVRQRAFDLLVDQVPKNGQSSDNVDSNQDNKDHKSLILIFEPYFIQLQSLLLWDEPQKSAIGFFVASLAYWIIVTWTTSFLSLACFVAFCLKLYKLWTFNIWPEIRVPPNDDQKEKEDFWTPVHPQALSAPEISKFMDRSQQLFSDSITYLLHLRSKNHGMFCLLMTSSFAVMAILGHLFSGALIVYTTFSTLALLPGLCVYILPVGFLKMMRNIFSIEDIPDPADDSQDVFADNEKNLSSSFKKVTPSSSSHLFDLLSPSRSEMTNEDNKFDHEIGILEPNTSAAPSDDVNFIKRAISSALAMATPSPSESDGSGASSGRSSNGFKMVSTAIDPMADKSTPSTPEKIEHDEEDGDQDSDNEFEIVSETEIENEHLKGVTK